MSNRARRTNFVAQLIEINEEDLQYVERDLCFHELVALGFLLFGDERANAEFVLQKLLVLAANATDSGAPPDLLRKYASVNPGNWRASLVEALAIIGARRVLRKLGFNWEELSQHYLPDVAELSLHVHRLLKALYKMCERLPPAQAGRLIMHINDEHKRTEDHLRFYDFTCAEVFLLDWITRRIITVGDRDANGANVEVLLQYFKLHEMDDLKALLVSTINSTPSPTKAVETPQTNKTLIDSSSEEPLPSCPLPSSSKTSQQPLPANDVNGNRTCYTVRRAQVGIVLIINQRTFYEESAEELRHLLPRKKLNKRCGTDVDRRKIEEVFGSFGYTPIVKENLDHIELLHCIRETVKLSFQYDSFILFILSHGIDGAVYGSNSIPIDIIDIEQIMTTDTLQDKPKMLIIQACQKDESPTTTNFEKKKFIPSSANEPNVHADMIKAMSTVPGFPSMRHTATGSWFIQALCDSVHKFGDKKHMLDILIMVNGEVSNKRGDKNELMVPLTRYTTGKFFFLPQRKVL